MLGGFIQLFDRTGKRSTNKECTDQCKNYNNQGEYKCENRQRVLFSIYFGNGCKTYHQHTISQFRTGNSFFNTVKFVFYKIARVFFLRELFNNTVKTGVTRTD